MLLLDTNIASYLMRRDVPLVSERFATALRLNESVHLSAIVYAELQFGVIHAVSPRRQSALRHDLSTLAEMVSVLAWPVEAAAHFAMIRSRLAKAGNTIGYMDALIAAHALALNATVVTNNEKEFRRVPGLNVENWTKK